MFLTLDFIFNQLLLNEAKPKVKNKYQNLLADTTNRAQHDLISDSSEPLHIYPVSNRGTRAICYHISKDIYLV